MKKVLIIGGGPAGCSAAHLLSEIDELDITLIEANSTLGAGVRTHYYGGHPYTFGPRHFLTQNKKVYDFINKIVPMRSCADHEFISYVEKDNNFYNFPIHMEDIKKMPDSTLILNEIKQAKGVQNANNIEDFWIGSVGKTLYDKIIKDYNKKMWLVDDNKKLDTFNWSPKGVTIKEGNRAAWDNAISAYPYAKNGYNDYFDTVIDKIKVLLNTRIDSFDILNKTIYFQNTKEKFDIIINTISPDTLFDFCFGELPFIGRDLHKIVFPTEFVFPKNVYFIYYPNKESFTRLVEYKKFTHHISNNSLIGMEIPSTNGKHYPLPIKAEQKKAKKYHDHMPEGVYSIGRAGTYRYLVDIDDCIELAMKIADDLKYNKFSGTIPLKKWTEFK